MLLSTLLYAPTLSTIESKRRKDSFAPELHTTMVSAWHMTLVFAWAKQQYTSIELL
jgi:hypothetical protein